MTENNNLERQNVDLATFDGNPNIGLYLFATNDYCLAPESISDKLLHKVEKVLDVPVIKLNLAGTPLLGVFLSGDSEQLLVPSIIFDKEQEILRSNNINFKVFDTELTALGNNIIFSKDALLINHDYDINSRKKLRELTGKNIISEEFGDVKTIGSAIIVRGKRAVISPLLERYKQLIKDLLKLDAIEVSSVNFGNPYVSSGLVANDKGLLIGEKTTGLESMKIEQALGFTKYE